MAMKSVLRKMKQFYTQNFKDFLKKEGVQSTQTIEPPKLEKALSRFVASNIEPIFKTRRKENLLLNMDSEF